MRVRFRHLRHPLRSARTLFRMLRTLYRRARLPARLEKRLIRGVRSSCWCGGSLLPFQWHPSYGVCSECGTYVNRRPPTNLHEVYHRDAFYWKVLQEEYGNPPLEDRARCYREDGRLPYWLDLVRRHGVTRGRVALEIGCAPGVLLAELQTRGWECTGVDPDPWVAAWIRQHFHVDCRTGLFPEVSVPECDLFLAMDVLEHVEDPAHFLRGASRVLRAGGIAILQTPIERYGHIPPFGDAFTKGFLDYEHSYLFTDAAVEQLAAQAGLEVVSQKERMALLHEISVLRKPEKLGI